MSFSELNNRVLWYDGAIQVSPEEIPSLLLQGVPISKIVPTFSNDDVELFNLIEEFRLPGSKVENEPPNFEWNIPKLYTDIDLHEYLIWRIDGKPEQYKIRLENELAEIKNRKLVRLFQTLIYIVDEFGKNNVVWGVGRGSSCASLVLYLIGLHLVDPIRFNIPMTEFFHD